MVPERFGSERFRFRDALTPRAKAKNWYERLDEDTKAIVLGIGLIIFVLLLVFIISNPLLAGVILAVFGLGTFTVYAKYRTGHWWWKTYSSSSNSAKPASDRQLENEPVIVERQTITKEVFIRKCTHCGAKVPSARINCPNCGANL